MGIVEEFCKRFCIKDSEKFLELFSDDALYVDSLYGKYTGKDQIKAFHERCHKEAKNYKFIPKNIIFSEGKAAFEWEISFELLTPFGKGKKVKAEGASFMEIEDGKIKAYREYSDSIFILLSGNVPEEKIIKFYRKKYRSVLHQTALNHLDGKQGL